MSAFTTRISIEGISCDHCARAISNGLKKLDGVGDVRDLLTEKSAEVSYNTSKVIEGDLRSAIEDEGYSAGGGELPNASPS